MNEWATSKIISWLAVDKDSTTGIKIGFYIETMLSEVEKILIILFVFSLFGYFKEIAIILLIITTLRPYIGGTHKDTFIGCLGKTILMCAIPICLCDLLSSGYIIHIHIVATVLLVCIIWIIDPVTSRYRPKYEGEKLKKIRIKATILILVIFICYIPLDVAYKKGITILLCLLMLDIIIARVHQIIER